jgi:hypothetical protein
MARPQIFRTGLVFCCLLLGAVGTSCKRPGGWAPGGSISPDATVTNNLWQIWHLLEDIYTESDTFPKSLSQIPAADSNLFVCPGTGSKPGPMATVEDWGDYIYIGGMPDGVPLAALIISPPENHNGKYGYVQCLAGRLVRLPPDEIRKLVSQPLLLDTNASPDGIAYVKEHLSIRVPKRLRDRYNPVRVASLGQKTGTVESCEANLRGIWFALKRWMGDEGRFPASLNLLAQDKVSSNMFVCPATGHPPGALTNVESWTDYIYFGGYDDSTLGIPVLICPPESHGGRTGLVAWTDGHITSVPAAEVRSLVEKPWFATTNISQLELRYLKERIILHIPDRLRGVYTNASVRELNSTRQP